MLFDEFLAKAAESRAQGEAFATALVVRYEAPVSGKPGDKAIIYRDGRMWGWIGGGCAQPTVVKEALKALEDGTPRLVRISPSPNTDSGEGVVDYTMTCHSGGSLDIFIEPVLPRPRVVIFGRSAVAQVLAKLAAAIDYDVVSDGAKPGAWARTFVVVSTQGESDEEALEQALAMNATYVAFVASKTKAGKVFEYLREKGIASERLDKVRAPAGLQIGAVSPEEIAVSILAEIVEAGRRKVPEAQLPPQSEAKDPICGMMVDPRTAKHKSEYNGTTYYFCCARCKQVFDQAPDRVLSLA